MRRVGWMGGVVMAALLGLSRCADSARCDVVSCADGCCDADGVCRPGESDSACGAFGFACQDCRAAGLSCASRACVGSPSAQVAPDGGQVSRDGGQGSSVDGGKAPPASDGGCLEITSFVPVLELAGYFRSGSPPPQDHYVMAVQLDQDADELPDGGTYNLLWLEVWPDKSGKMPSLPATRALDGRVPYSGCDICMGLHEGCAQGKCARYFYAVGGTVTVTQADKDEAEGALRASGGGLRLVEWSFSASQGGPVPGGRCIDLGSFRMDISWSADGGS